MSLFLLCSAGLCRTDSSDGSVMDSATSATMTVVQGDLPLPDPPEPEMENTASSDADAAAPPIGLLETLKGRALRAMAAESSLVPVFEKGGPIMWPLLLASILALGTVIDRLFFLAGVGLRRNTRATERFFSAVAEGDVSEAIRISKASRYYVLRTLGYALEHKDNSVANALLYAQEREMKRFRQGIPILDTIITLAPLLGLLGTVTGMMGSFSLIGGELSTPGAVTGGIAEALIATAYGLGIAITSLLPFNYLNNRMEEARLEIESAANRLELLMLPLEKETENA